MQLTEQDAIARQAALLQYAAAHDRWSEEEQYAVERGEYAYGQYIHDMANHVLRAYRNELDDPEPKA